MRDLEKLAHGSDPLPKNIRSNNSRLSKVRVIFTTLLIGLIFCYQNQSIIKSFSTNTCDFQEDADYHPIFLKDLFNNFLNYKHIKESSSIEFLQKKYLSFNNFIEVINGNQFKFYNIHSHNDYWQSSPLFNALERNLKSVEADVWYLPSLNLQQKCPNNVFINEKSTNLKEAELYVGHQYYSLSVKNTLNSLYLDHLKNLLEDQKSLNKPLSFYHNYPNESLGLIVDIKTRNSYSVYKLLMKKLEPLKDYLTYFDFESGKLVHGPLHIILSGHIPIQEILNEDSIKLANNNGKRYVFFDEDLLNQESISSVDTLLSSTDFARILVNHNKFFYPIKSQTLLTENQLTRLNEATKNAQGNTRVWGIPSPRFFSYIVPNFAQKERIFEAVIWKDLMIKGGVSMMNVDDLDYGMGLFDEIHNRN